ncbi:MAG: response regulator [Treponema sp.]|nr:response regulator [Candidatus Treponema scatequi]
MAGQRNKIIIIDDVELNRTILGEAFSKKYEVLEAQDGAEGLEKIFANENELAAIFLDIIMPEMDGFSVLQELELKNVMRKIPLFIITTETTDYVVEKAYNYGVIDVIQKPFNLLIIERRVANIIELFENRNHIAQHIAEKQNAAKAAFDAGDSATEKYKKALDDIAKIMNETSK